MVVEVLYDDQAWPIGLPAEPPRNRRLEARHEDGSVAHTWIYQYGAWWTNYRVTWKWWAIVEEAMVNDLTLWSLPPDTPGVPGGTIPRED